MCWSRIVLKYLASDWPGLLFKLRVHDPSSSKSMSRVLTKAELPQSTLNVFIEPTAVRCIGDNLHGVLVACMMW